MKAIVGLGNPDRKYERTRHNIGFLFVDWLVRDLGDVKWKKKFSGLYAQEGLWSDQVAFLKPQTYMNRSGVSVQKMLDYYKIGSADAMIISDDIDMDFGKIRYRETGKAGGHNGLTDIFQKLGTSDIARIKIGIGRHPHMDPSDWVLSALTDDEIKSLEDDIFPQVRNLLQEKFFT